MRARAIVTMLAASMFVAGCAATVSPDSVMSGDWTYTGTQDNPPATLAGSVSWRGVSGGPGAFEGTYSVVEQLASGAQRTLSGSGAGQLLADTVADFDLTVDGIARRHIGVLHADSINGNWAILDVTHAASGHFVMRRGR